MPPGAQSNLLAGAFTFASSFLSRPARPANPFAAANLA
jgi:hypothetical protein